MHFRHLDHILANFIIYWFFVNYLVSFVSIFIDLYWFDHQCHMECCCCSVLFTTHWKKAAIILPLVYYQVTYYKSLCCLMINKKKSVVPLMVSPRRMYGVDEYLPVCTHWWQNLKVYNCMSYFVGIIITTTETNENYWFFNHDAIPLSRIDYSLVYYETNFIVACIFVRWFLDPSLSHQDATLSNRCAVQR